TVSVRAMAKVGDPVYTSGPIGLEQTMEIPYRLITPPIAPLKFIVNETGKESDPAVPISIAGFTEKGFRMEYQTTNADAYQTGKYQLSISVHAKDAEETFIEYLYSPEEPLTIPGRLLGDKVVIPKLGKMRTQYSGLNLHIQIRSTSINSISSLWSPSRTISLPKIQMDKVPADALGKTTENCDIYKDGSSTPEAGDKAQVKQESFTWQHCGLAKGYTVQLQRLEKDSGSLPYVDELSWSFKGDSQVPEVYFLDSKKKSVISEKGDLLKPEITQEDANTTLYTYKLYNRKVQLINSQKLPLAYSVELNGTLKIRVVTDEKKAIKSISYVLLLPEGEIQPIINIPDSVAFTTNFTKTIAFTANARDTIFMVDSLPSIFTRKTDDSALRPLSDGLKEGIIYGKLNNSLLLLRQEIAGRVSKITDPIIVSRPVVPEQPTPSSAPEPTPTPTPTEEPTPTPTPTPTEEPTPIPTPTPTVEPTPTPTPAPTEEPTPSPTTEPTPPPSEEPGSKPPEESTPDSTESTSADFV
ncbi:MAG: hypothetical protein RSC76_04930, partial [Oscillospiraceae bacterium]